MMKFEGQYIVDNHPYNILNIEKTEGNLYFLWTVDWIGVGFFRDDQYIGTFRYKKDTRIPVFGYAIGIHKAIRIDDVRYLVEGENLIGLAGGFKGIWTKVTPLETETTSEEP